MTVGATMQVRAIIERMKGRGLTYEDTNGPNICSSPFVVLVVGVGGDMESQTNRSEACQYVNGALGEDQWRRVESEGMVVEVKEQTNHGQIFVQVFMGHSPRFTPMLDVLIVDFDALVLLLHSGMPI
ncbi:hypothetical protein B0H13DRAFT_1867720 [Mycena leptocephala]|nr:hypothetical protein B0H13DRAFT_1867720 [Mycena leptocephala]